MRDKIQIHHRQKNSNLNLIQHYIIENVSSSTTTYLREFKKILPSTIIYEPILIKKNRKVFSK